MDQEQRAARPPAVAGGAAGGRLWVTAAIAALLVGPTAAMAADDQPAASASHTVEEVVVTGSLIRGTPPTGSSLISVGQQDIQKSTAPTVGEFLKNVPQVLGLGIDPGHKIGSGSGNVTYGSSINLRGLGPGATLLLYNGERLPRSGTSIYVDNSSIPGIAVQRIEVIADGASATYGSDAVAGVVNIITRTNVSGLEVSAQGGFADGTSDYDFSAIGGHQWTDGGFMIAGDYTVQNRLTAADRDYSRTSDFRSLGGTDLRNTTCNPGTVTLAGRSYALPGLTPGSNLCDTVQYNDLLPKLKRWTIISHVEQHFGDKVLWTADGFFNRREHDYHLATSSTRGGVPATQSLAVPVTNAFYQAPPGVAPGTETVTSFLGAALGDYETDTGPEETWSFNTNVRFDLPSEWRLNVNANFGHNWNKTTRRGINASALNAALASSNPATSINPYAPSASTPSSVVAAINDWVSLASWNQNDIEDYKAQVDGPLFSLPGGQVKLAVGLEHRREAFSTFSLSGRVEALSGTAFSPDRKVDSVYGELNAPIVSADNAMTGIQRLTLSLAVRAEKYSDFGKTTNPKVGVTWDPVEGLSIRGSAGKSFRAPDLGSLTPVGPASVIYILPGGPDPKNGGAPSTVALLSAGNPDLQPERAKTYSLGFDLHPTFLPGFRGSLTYFKIDYSNVIINLVTQNALAREQLYPANYTRDPATIAAEINAFVAKGAFFNPAPPATFANITAAVNAAYMNAGVTNLNGFDFDVSYHWTVDSIGDLEVGTVGTYYNSYKVAPSPTAPAVESVSTYGNPPRLRARSHLGWSRGPFNANGYVNFTSSYKDVAQKRTVDSWTTIDLDASVDLDGLIDNSMTKNSRIIFAVANLLDKDPPFYNGYYGYDPQNGSPIGRRFQITLDKKF